MMLAKQKKKRAGVAVKTALASSLLTKQGTSQVSTASISTTTGGTTTTSTNTQKEEEKEEEKVEQKEESKNQFVEGFYEYYTSGKYSDLDIEFEGKTYHVHKIILSYTSPYFKDLIDNSNENPLKLDYKDPDNLFPSILEYIYSGSTEFKYENIINWKHAANHFKIGSLKSKVSDFVSSNLTSENVLTLLDQCSKNVEENDSVVEAAIGYIAKHFDELYDKVVLLAGRKDIPVEWMFNLLEHKDMDKEFDPEGIEKVAKLAETIKEKRNFGKDILLNQQLIAALLKNNCLTAETAVSNLHFCEEHNLEIAKGCARVVASVFNNLENTDLIYNLKPETVIELLGNDELQVVEEDEVLQIAKSYIEKHPEIDEELKKKIMGTVRISFLSVDQLKVMQKDPPKYVNIEMIIDSLWARVGRLEKVDINDESMKNKAFTPRKTSMFTHEKDFDTKGILYFIGTKHGAESYTNPLTLGEVDVQSTSACENGGMKDIISHTPVACNLKNKPNSIITINLKDYSVRPTAYSLRHTLSRDSEALRNWELRASKDGKIYDTLLVHTGDAVLNTKGATHTWTIPNSAVKGSYRYFQLEQTGANSSSNNYMSVAGFELYGRLNIHEEKEINFF